MDPKGKAPLMEDEPSSFLHLKTPRGLFEDKVKKLKIDDNSGSSCEERLTLFSKANIPRSTLPTAERGATDRKVVWKGRLTGFDVYYGTLKIPVKSAGPLYKDAQKIPTRRNTRLATVEDEEGSPWKMKVERQRNQVLLDCDKYFKWNGLQIHDTVVVTFNSRFGYYIDYFKCWGRRGCTSKKYKN